MPPALTRPTTVDCRMLMSHRKHGDPCERRQDLGHDAVGQDLASSSASPARAVRAQSSSP
jgi:hypothetical protein